MKQTIKEKSSQKLTRWDRIRKRNTSKISYSLKTDIVRNFIEKDYINQNDESVLCGKSVPNKVLNPVLVMDIRHEMVMEVKISVCNKKIFYLTYIIFTKQFRKIPRKLPLATVGGLRTIDACVNHNLVVEERYIMNELNKFRQQLQKNHKRNTLRMKISQNVDNKIYDMDNKYLSQSLVRTAEHIKNFYAAPLEALQKVDEVCEAARLIKNNKELEEPHENENIKGTTEVVTENIFKAELAADVTSAGSEDDHLLKNTITDNANVEYTETVNLNKYSEKIFEEIGSSNIKIGNEPEGSTPDTISENKCVEKDQEFLKGRCKCPNSANMELNAKASCRERCVRFVETVNIKNFNRENSICSNTSDGIDSVVSDLAEEALFELQMEAEEKLTHENESNMETKNAAEPIEVEINFKDTLTSQYEENTLEPLVITKLSTTTTKLSIPKEVDSAITTSEELEDESISNHEQNLIIQQLFRPRANTNTTLLRRYFLKWIHFITIEKIEREDVSSKSDRVHKINMFLDKIRKEKLRLTRYARQCNTGQAREQTQKAPVVSTQTTKKYQNK